MQEHLRAASLRRQAELRARLAARLALPQSGPKRKASDIEDDAILRLPGPPPSRPELLDAVSVLEMLPFDEFARVLLYDPYVNAGVLSRVSKRVALLVTQAANMPGFFEAAVRRCFPLVTRLPLDFTVLMPEYREAVRVGGREYASNVLWRELFLRLFDMMLTLFISHGPFRAEPADIIVQLVNVESRILTCSQVVGRDWTVQRVENTFTGRPFVAGIYTEARAQYQTLLRPGLPNDQLLDLLADQQQGQYITLHSYGKRPEDQATAVADDILTVNGHDDVVLSVAGRFEGKPGPLEVRIGDAPSSIIAQVSIVYGRSEYTVTFRPALVDDDVLQQWARRANVTPSYYRPPPAGHALEGLVPEIKPPRT